MKPILMLHTGGTIGSVSGDAARALNGETVRQAKRLLVTLFSESDSRYAGCPFVDAGFPEELTTLSESMDPDRLWAVAAHLRGFDLSAYAGVILLHGTDTLAYSAALFSFLFSGISVPMVLVSGNRPPQDEGSNAAANFRAAAQLIWDGLAPHVYAVYRNGDGVTRLYLGSTLMQCPNRSEDFRSGSEKTVFPVGDEGLFERCRALSEGRDHGWDGAVAGLSGFDRRVLLVTPYTGLDYSVYAPCLEGCAGVVHGTYHSGTVSLSGYPEESRFSVLYLARLCEKVGIPLYIAPSRLGTDQYETMGRVVRACDARLLNMTAEAAYAKLMLAAACRLPDLDRYMQTPICGEFLE